MLLLGFARTGRGTQAEPQLWVLHRLNIIDKHRLLTPILSHSLDVGFGGRFEFHDEEQAHPPILQAWDGLLEDGRVVLIVTTPAPTKRALMDVSFTAGVGLTVDDVLLGGVDGVLGNLVSAVADTSEELTPLLA